VLAGDAARSVTLAAGRGTEVRFNFRDTTADSAAFRFDVAGAADSDAVLTRLPVRPAYFPRNHTASGVVRTRDTVTLALPHDIDPARSRLVFSVGSTPISVMRGMLRWLAVYPYDCSEQVADEILPLAALLRAGTGPDGRSYAPAGARAQLEAGVAVLSRRQRTDGGVGLWSAEDWTTPWLSAFAGEALLAARGAGVSVSDSVLARLADYLFRSVHQPGPLFGPLAPWFNDHPLRLGEDVAAVDFLSRFRRPDVAGENQLLRVAPQLLWEDRVRLAEVLARRGGDAADAARRLLAPIWADVRIEGRRAVIPDSARRRFYFWSYRRPVARLLTATLAVDSASPLVGPLVETLIEQGRSATRWWWNTQDYGAAVEALSDFGERQRRATARGFTVRAAGRRLFGADSAAPAGDFSAPLAGLLTDGADGSKNLALAVTVPLSEDSAPLFYYATVDEVPLQRPVTPDQQGIEVERWYEDYATGAPTVSAVEGALVRVRLRIRIPAERRFVALTDPLPAGLEAVDLSLRTTGGLPGPGAARPGARAEGEGEGEQEENPGGYLWGWYYGSWDSGWWSPFDHKEMRDDRVAYFATYLWPGTYTASYVARATTPGVFVRPPAHAEEMYNPSVQGRSDGGAFTVTAKTP
jgi:alpha-2-macroglobulin